jgi:NAD-dependent DNA ligase
MSTLFGRQIGAAKNEYKHSLGALVGIAQGLVCDRRLEDKEIFFLHDWLAQNRAMAEGWPGDIVFSRVKEVLADGVITDGERTYLIDTLMKLVGSDGPDLPKVAHATRLATDDSPLAIIFTLKGFCFTGDFVYGSRSACEHAVEKRGGKPCRSVNKKLDYLVIGSLGSPEWKHGSFGLKVERAMKYKQDGHAMNILNEEKWCMALGSDV